MLKVLCFISVYDRSAKRLSLIRLWNSACTRAHTVMSHITNKPHWSSTSLHLTSLPSVSFSIFILGWQRVLPSWPASKSQSRLILHRCCPAYWWRSTSSKSILPYSQLPPKAFTMVLLSPAKRQSKWRAVMARLGQGMRLSLSCWISQKQQHQHQHQPPAGSFCPFPVSWLQKIC